jgi:carbon-monoxide dehydrogenase medium subunit
LVEYGDDAMVVGGGLTVVILLRERLVRPRALISLSEIPELGRITVNGNASIGATATHTRIARSSELVGFAPLICEACSRVGSPGIRNMGTLGGSVSHGDGASDTAPALLALGAEVVMTGPEGTRTVPLKDFFFGVLATALGEGEILTAIRIPPAAVGTRTRFKKYTCTSVEAFATVTVATAVQMGPDQICTDARIGLGSVAPMPVRATAAEALLRGKKFSPDLISEAANVAAGETDPSSDGQGTSEYRREMTRVWVRRLLEDTMAG